MANDSEPRALGAALAAPAFVTRSHGVAMHAANRHVERWAPEASAGQVRSMRSLGFVDRLVAPWMETAQRSASLRLFDQYASAGLGQRQGSAVSWVFPRPWYQDELDWMAAARQASAQSEAARPGAPSLLTTRGTYVAPAAPAAPPSGGRVTAPPLAMPSALYEYVAPALSLASARPAAIAGVGHGGDALPRAEAYSPLVPLAAVQAAELMTRAVAPLLAPSGTVATAAATAATRTPVSAGLRSVLTSILARAGAARGDAPTTRIAGLAPELVTPPAPRSATSASDAADRSAELALEPAASSASQVADQLAAQRTRIAELQRIAQQSAQRELAARHDAMSTAASADRAPASTGAPAGRAAAPASAPAQAPADLRAVAERAEAELRQRAGAARAREAEAATAAERASVHASVHRLHDQARAEAAAHARAAGEPALRPAGSAEAPVVASSPRASAEVVAAAAGLPPELAAVLSPAIARRPEHAMQAISQLHEALRTVELLARSSAAGTTFEATRGPRLVMPAGLGGLVSAVDRAQAIAERPAMLAGQRALAPLPQLVGPVPAPALPAYDAQGARGRDARVPSLPWLFAAPRAQAAAPSSALASASAASPAALSHVAWADRWLARFAGAGAQSLATISAAGASAPMARMRALASAAPGVVFVAPELHRAVSAGVAAADSVDAVARPATAALSPAAAPSRAPLAELRRFDDEAETPDDVFAAISAAASRGRTTASRPSAPAPAAAAPSAPPASAASAHLADRQVLADRLAQSAPSAPGAGLSAQLASSPFAPALRHVLTLSSAPSFDVRALFGAGLGATYLAGLIVPASREVEIGAAAPAWASWRGGSALGAELPGTDRLERGDLDVPGFEATYVRGEMFSPASGDAAEPSPAAGDRSVSSELAAIASAGRADHAPAPLTTLRTALLSSGLSPALAAWAASAGALGATSAAAGEADAAGVARRIVEPLSLPMLGEADELPAAWAAPGMIAERAHTWSVAQERSAADLAFDFVAPELVLAARVYGLGPAEAAQAARLAIAGPGQLGAMASTVDRTFVEALAIGRDARVGSERAPASADPGAPEPRAGVASPGGSPRGAEIATAFPTPDGAIAAVVGSSRSAAQAPPGGAAFGVARRAPRGAFLWPSATVAALGMTAASPDGQLAMSVAALELLAAQVVAEIGTYTALSTARAAGLGDDGVGAGPSALASGGAGADRIAARVAASPSAEAGSGGDRADAASGAEPAEAEVLGAAAALVPTSRRARFDALYVALSQSPSGLHWSPAARAARALALAGRAGDGAITACERAATAWDVLPVVYGGAEPARTAPASGEADASSGLAESASAAIAQAMARHVAPSWLGGPRASASAPAARAPRGASFGGPREVVAPLDHGAAERVQVGGPGLAGLSARAGEALGSFLTPAAAPAAPQERSVDLSSAGAVLRAPTAAPEYVQTGRSAGRYGGGEVEIPVWFEAAARKMFAERSDSADGISLAELTLVTAAPASHVAASTRSAPSASPPSPSTASAAQQPNAPQIDVEKLADEVYRNILVLMDVVRARNGDPYL